MPSNGTWADNASAAGSGGLTRRKLLLGSAALAGGLTLGPAAGGALAADSKTAAQPKRLPPPPPPPAKETLVEMLPLSHDDLDWNGQSRFRSKGFVWVPDPLWFWWGYITGMEGQKNPILAIRPFLPNVPALPLGMTHHEFLPGLFRNGVDLLTQPGSMFREPAGAAFSGVLDLPGWHRRAIGRGDPDNLGAAGELTWEMSGQNPLGKSRTLYRAGTKAHRIVEVTDAGTTLLDVRADYAPLCPIVTPPAPFGIYQTGAALAQGTYRGRDVWFMSGFDRFMDVSRFLPAVLLSPFYQAFVYSKCHEDGRLAWGACYVYGSGPDDYTGFGAYCIEGEEPVCSHDVEFDGTWVANANDRSQIAPLEMTYRWKSLDNGKSVELKAVPTHSTILDLGAAKVGEVFCEWEEKSAPAGYARSMAAIEYSVKPGSVPVSRTYEPSTRMT